MKKSLALSKSTALLSENEISDSYMINQNKRVKNVAKGEDVIKENKDQKKM
jgi:putative IMPACT (imprinted ancient) family translation regulator